MCRVAAITAIPITVIRTTVTRQLTPHTVIRQVRTWRLRPASRGRTLDPVDNRRPHRVPQRFPMAAVCWPSVSARPPGLGEHTDAILKEFGFSKRDIASLHKAKAV